MVKPAGDDGEMGTPLTASTVTVRTLDGVSTVDLEVSQALYQETVKSWPDAEMAVEPWASWREGCQSEPSRGMELRVRLEAQGAVPGKTPKSKDWPVVRQQDIETGLTRGLQ
jgi:hypothetical protein